MLVAFLEKDNVKLLAYKGSTRLFAGQISFSPEVLRDAYVADAAKFSGQLKMAFSQKDALREDPEVTLFLPADKTFTKTLPATDPVDGFVQSLPYFKEELVISNNQLGKDKITYVAFEKKLVEDLQKPFLESGKKVVAVKSALNVLITGLPQQGQYLLLASFDKEIAVAVALNGAVSEIAAFEKSVFVTRFGEFVANHNLDGIKKAYTVGVFDPETANKLRTQQGLEITPLATTDIYDQIVNLSARTGRRFNFRLPNLPAGRPSKKVLLLLAAIIVGALLTAVIIKTVGQQKPETPSPVVEQPAPPPAPEPKISDYPVRVLNGTLVTGEAGRLADTLKGDGYTVLDAKNATSAGFTTTKILATSDVPEKIVAGLQTLLLQTYQTVAVEPLASTSAEIEIIIGVKKS
ncbi:MAG: LytR C-terminal domain-containing protein [Patescibacteria group bacterium]|nr:LytR C-terminal domain-containing protein [Patescibacteria group bacterium]MCL5432271.1 LytR C-terminal domain-containing protein [Patescibacteria group bacterium]